MSINIFYMRSNKNVAFLGIKVLRDPFICDSLQDYL